MADQKDPAPEPGGKSEDAALRRVEVLRQAGIWPGVRRHRDGTASPTFDPGGTPRRTTLEGA